MSAARPEWIEGLIAEPTLERVKLAVSDNSSFAPTFPGFQNEVDSTSLGDFKRCPRYYFYSMVCGLSGLGESPHLTFGLLMHSASEHYQHARAGGEDHANALDATLEHLLLSTWDSQLNRPWSSGHKTKNRQGIIQTVVWYLDNYRDDPIETVILANGKPAVELSFGFDSGYRVAGIQVNFRGHLDRLGMLAGEPIIPDIKTTERALDQKWFDGWTPGNQFSLYALAGRVVYDMPVTKIAVDGIQVGVGFARFHRQMVPRSDAMVKEWHLDAGKWIGEMAKCAGEGYWPMNDKSCDMYGGCQFRQLCSKSPLAREQTARAFYKRRIWDPTKVRGDI